jgi:hypothetical protein
MSPRKKLKTPQATRTGPVKVGSPLYRLLEAVAARVAARLEREATHK